MRRRKNNPNPFAALIGVLSLIVALLYVAGFAYRWSYYYNFGVQHLVFKLNAQTFLVTAFVLVSGGWKSPWFIWYLCNAAAAAFVLGAGASLLVSSFNGLVYLSMLMLTGSVRFGDRGFMTALYQISFLYVATFFFLKGAANLKEPEPVEVTVYSLVEAVSQTGHVPAEFSLVACSRENSPARNLCW